MSTPKPLSTYLTPLSLLLLCLTILYTGLLLLSPPGWLPGDPVWALRPETLQEIMDESLNFFFVLPLANGLGIDYLQAPTVHPIMQAFFNFAEAWIFMFLPLLLLDPRGRRLPKLLIWSLAMFLTNIFLMPYMAVRLWQEPEKETKTTEKGRLARFFGFIGLWVGLLAVVWAIFVRPDLGGLSDRLAYLFQQIMTNRVTLAFCIDLILFSIFQAWLMGAIMQAEETFRWLRFIPFWGLAVWLIL